MNGYIARVFVRAASGRQRFNVLGAWNAVTRALVSVTNSTVANTDTMCQLRRAIAAQDLVGPVTLVLDNARYQRNKVVQQLAAELSIRLLFLPSYSPNLNLIERLWGGAKRHSVYGRYHPDFASFRTAIETTLAGSKRSQLMWMYLNSRRELDSSPMVVEPGPGSGLVALPQCDVR
ncbi:Integrase core domain protein [Gemmata obscuriglobus]|uniref:Tc1-like transposase DDE domain-containing protein n=1 Tax=Gemmata obscuriglobus TaxID=114 RepID=A0A2Z3H022_9BACT|nr:hypothetical protein C1280_12070 [Gemmata obscuriglobus]QEG29549.1 Integrase core domain protein [Gemmata obscuriglobus]VTS08777.1 transposase : Uncharacterized protein OS=Microcystis aeruginosa TAIHU98 GN=O53_1377 PE=4 SV=1: DDE_3 [Gemmata obscuriglobus UQM 2246]